MGNNCIPTVIQKAKLHFIYFNSTGTLKMDVNTPKIAKNRNKLTTNIQVTDMALTLLECSDYLTKAILRTNLNSYCRDRLVRINQRLSKEAMGLGGDLLPPNLRAFESINGAKLIARQLGLTE